MKPMPTSTKKQSASKHSTNGPQSQNFPEFQEFSATSVPSLQNIGMSRPFHNLLFLPLHSTDHAELWLSANEFYTLPTV
jgi:hypothetical protein